MFGALGLDAEREREERVWKPREGGHMCCYKGNLLAPHLVSSVDRKNQSKPSQNLLGLSERVKLHYTNEDK